MLGVFFLHGVWPSAFVIIKLYCNFHPYVILTFDITFHIYLYIYVYKTLFYHFLYLYNNNYRISRVHLFILRFILHSLWTVNFYDITSYTILFEIRTVRIGFEKLKHKRPIAIISILTQVTLVRSGQVLCSVYSIRFHRHYFGWIFLPGSRVSRRIRFRARIRHAF